MKNCKKKKKHFRIKIGKVNVKLTPYSGEVYDVVLYLVVSDHNHLNPRAD